MSPQEIAVIFGDPCPDDRFSSIYSKAFVKFLRGPDVNGTARIISCRSSEVAETVICEIDVVLPQHPLADIQEKELVACRFPTGRCNSPDVSALRDSFPRLPHQNLQAEGKPKSLCLNATPWSESKHLWSPSSFLESIRMWLSRAAAGTLHSPGQPREPVLAIPDGFLLLPSSVDFKDLDKLHVVSDFETNPLVMWGEVANPDAKPKLGSFKLVCFEMPPREHGLIETIPANLLDLENLCNLAGFDLRHALSEKVKHIASAGRSETSEFSFNLLLLLRFPVTGSEDPGTTTQEDWAFVIGRALDVGVALGVIAETDGMVAPLIGQPQPSEDSIKSLVVTSIAPFRKLDEKQLLTSSGLSIPYPPVAVIGVGSLGSKCIETLARQGLSKAVLIDGDRLFPHNTARHALFGDSVGHPKTKALAHLLRLLHDSEPNPNTDGFVPICDHFKSPASEEITIAISGAEYILDFSASVDVSRTLSQQGSLPRCFSAFIAPGAETFFIHKEDSERKIRLDWLEAITLRAIVEDKRLRLAYTRNSGKIWYGGSCREVSTILPNQNVSLFAAVAAGVFTRHHNLAEAKCIGYSLDPETMALEGVEIEPTTPRVFKSNGWTIRFDSKIIDEMQAMRVAAFPNETGGVLLGVLDRERMSCCVLLASDSPLDSQTWPDAYVRGVDGLRGYVDDIVRLTAGQLQYIGEWHSHPEGCSNRPSNTDREALRILTDIMGREGLPAVSFIVGENTEPHISVGC